MKSCHFLTILLLSLLVATSAVAGEIKFVTYFSDPRAASVYDRLHLPPGPALPDLCTTGVLYVKQEDGKAYFCNKDSQWMTFGTSWSGAENSAIYPNDLTANLNLQVGIGLAEPSHSLEVRDPVTPSHVFFFDADKAALRAGNDSQAWSQEKLGEFSIAFGDQAQASGRNSFAGGFQSVASGENAFAFGEQAQALGETSTALGSFAKVSGERSVVFSAGTQDQKILTVNNTAAFLGGNVFIGDEGSASSAAERFLQVYHKKMSMVSVKTKMHDYKLAAVSGSAVVGGSTVQRGFYIVDEADNQILLGIDAEGRQMSFGGGSAQYDFDIHGDMRIDGLAGAGNAYACVDENGVIYRGGDSCSKDDELTHIVCPQSVINNRNAVPDYNRCVAYASYARAGCDLSTARTVQAEEYLIEVVSDSAFRNYPDHCVVPSYGVGQ